MNRVFVVQEPIDFSTGERKIDISPAAKHGEIIFLCPIGSIPYDLSLWITRMKEQLQDFSDADFILLTGHPTLMCIAACIAAEYNDGFIKFLRWHKPRGSNGDYKVEQINLWEEEVQQSS